MYTVHAWKLLYFHFIICDQQSNNKIIVQLIGWKNEIACFKICDTTLTSVYDECIIINMEVLTKSKQFIIEIYNYTLQNNNMLDLNNKNILKTSSKRGVIGAGMGGFGYLFGVTKLQPDLSVTCFETTNDILGRIKHLIFKPRIISSQDKKDVFYLPLFISDKCAMFIACTLFFYVLFAHLDIKTWNYQGGYSNAWRLENYKNHFDRCGKLIPQPLLQKFILYINSMIFCIVNEFICKKDDLVVNAFMEIEKIWQKKKFLNNTTQTESRLWKSSFGKFLRLNTNWTGKVGLHSYIEEASLSWLRLENFLDYISILFNLPNLIKNCNEVLKQKKQEEKYKRFQSYYSNIFTNDSLEPLAKLCWNICKHITRDKLVRISRSTRNKVSGNCICDIIPKMNNNYNYKTIDQVLQICVNWKKLQSYLTNTDNHHCKMLYVMIPVFIYRKKLNQNDYIVRKYNKLVIDAKARIKNKIIDCLRLEKFSIMYFML